MHTKRRIRRDACSFFFHVENAASKQCNMRLCIGTVKAGSSLKLLMIKIAKHGVYDGSVHSDNGFGA